MRAGWLAALALLAACRGGGGDDDPDAGDDAPDGGGGNGCEATDPRSPATETFVAPTGFEGRVLDLIEGASTSIDLQMYLFTIESIADALVAADGRGVAVRVLLDPDHEGNAEVRSQLQGAGVPWRDAPSTFEFSHAKYLIIDGEAAMITSANFNYGAIGGAGERNYGAIVRDPDDLADLAAVFEADWSGAPLDLDCSRLVVSPINARTRLLELITAADETLDVEAIYLSDSGIRTAIIAAHDRGAAVRVIVASPGDFPDNASTIETLENQGIDVRVYTDALHAKLLIADGVAFVGSQNLSPTALGENREVGVLVTETAPVATIQQQFDADWAAAQ